MPKTRSQKVDAGNPSVPLDETIPTGRKGKGSNNESTEGSMQELTDNNQIMTDSLSGKTGPKSKPDISIRDNVGLQHMVARARTPVTIEKGRGRNTPVIIDSARFTPIERDNRYSR